VVTSYRPSIGLLKVCLLQSLWRDNPVSILDCKPYKFSICASLWGEETGRTVEDMEDITTALLHISIVNVMFRININEYEFMKQNRSDVLSDRWTHTQYKGMSYETASRWPKELGNRRVAASGNNT